MKKLGLFAAWLIWAVFLDCESAQAQQKINLTANEFASEAGAIGGTVKACGQNISDYNARVLSAINIFVKNPAEGQQALTIYEDALSKAETLQSKNRAIDCSKAIKDFNNLPLMQADYKQKVLPALAKMESSSVEKSTLTPDGTLKNAS